MAKPAPGEAELPLDMSAVSTVEDGLAVAERYERAFHDLARDALGPPEIDDRPFLENHLALYGFLNRAVSLHRGIIDCIRAENPHAVFTLMRAYLELLVLVHYVNRHPEYVEALQRPPAELPPGVRRRSSQALFAVAAREMPGVRRVYRSLNEMAHYGSDAFWTPFHLVDAEEGHIRFGTPPHWHIDKDARTAVAMLLENDAAVLKELVVFTQQHIVPGVLAGLQEDAVRE